MIHSNLIKSPSEHASSSNSSGVAVHQCHIELYMQHKLRATSRELGSNAAGQADEKRQYSNAFQSITII